MSIDKIQLYKEIGEIPYWLSIIYGYKGIIDDFSDPDINLDFFRTIRLHNYHMRPGILKNITKFLYLFKMAKKIDILYLLHISPGNLLRMIVYRLGRGKGKIYLKLDMSPCGIFPPKSPLLLENMDIKRKLFHKIFKKMPDIYTVETKKAYQEIAGSYYADLIKNEKLYLMPNGFDPLILVENNVQRKSVYEKEKIIITVGRIGTYQKNSELLLEIFADIDLKNWKLYIVGSIESNFMSKIDEFYLNNPDKKESVIFTGSINQKDLYEYYNKSRIFILTSRHESFGFVLAEAAYMNNYIISTNTGIAEELLEITNGFVTDIHKKEPFISELKKIIGMSDDEINKLVPDTDKKEITWEWILKNNEGIKKLCQLPEN